MSAIIPLTQGKVAIIDDADYPVVSQYKWCATKHNKGKIWYATTSINRKTIFLHRFILHPQKKLQVDHINHDGLDNRRINLRLASPVENIRNQRKRENTTSKYKGVRKVKNTRMWESYIQKNGKQIYLGNFSNEDDAAKNYDKFAKIYFGEYAKLNFGD